MTPDDHEHLTESNSHGEAVDNCDEDVNGIDDDESNINGQYIKAERVTSGIHFLTDQENDRTPDNVTPKSEANDNEPEIRKQVGCITTTSRKRYINIRNCRI